VTQQHRQLLMSGTGIENAANVVVSTVGDTAIGRLNKRSEIVLFRSILGRIVSLCGTLFFIKFNEL
jgi:hypothetical protein